MEIFTYLFIIPKNTHAAHRYIHYVVRQLLLKKLILAYISCFPVIIVSILIDILEGKLMRKRKMIRKLCRRIKLFFPMYIDFGENLSRRILCKSLTRVFKGV